MTAGSSSDSAATPATNRGAPPSEGRPATEDRSAEAAARALLDLSVSLSKEIDELRGALRAAEARAERARGEALEEAGRLVADDAAAISFQTLGQYRTGLLKALGALSGGPDPAGGPAA